MIDVIIKGGVVWTDGAFRKTNVMIENGTVTGFTDDVPDAGLVVEATGLEVLPGLIDPHVHFGLDLGFIRSVDGFSGGSAAAAFGGVTSVVDFLDPTDNAAALKAAYKRRLSEAEPSIIDYAFHATVKDPKDDLDRYVRTVRDLDMRTIKLFTTYSESGRRTYDADIRTLLELSKVHDVMIMAHVENDDMIVLDPSMTYKDLPESRPVDAEITEALHLADQVRDTGGSLYMVHVSSGETVRRLSVEYDDLLGKHFFVETCPQYLTFDSSVFDREDGHLYTCAPPIRSKTHVQLMFDHKERIDVIGTDHCAFMRKDKTDRRLIDMPLGIGGIEHSFNVMRHHLGDMVIDKMSARPAELHRLKNKGHIKVGYDADLFLFKPMEGARCEGSHGTSDHSLYEGTPCAGRVISTMVRGDFVMKDGVLIGGKGKLIGGAD
jgi:dihydropyrimidinase